MIFRASGCGRGGGCAAVARSLLAICGLALSLAPIWAEAEPNPAAAPPPSAPQTVTLRTLVVGGCQEAQRYAESLLGSGAVRSVAEVGRPLLPAPLSNLLCFSLFRDSLTLTV